MLKSLYKNQAASTRSLTKNYADMEYEIEHQTWEEYRWKEFGLILLLKRLSVRHRRNIRFWNLPFYESI